MKTCRASDDQGLQTTLKFLISTANDKRSMHAVVYKEMDQAALPSDAESHRPKSLLNVKLLQPRPLLHLH